MTAARRCVVVLAALMLLGAAGCSDGDDDAAPATSRDAATTTEGSDSSPTTAPPEYTGDRDSPFCTLLRDTDPSTVLAGDAGDPASVEAAFARLVDVLTRATEAAPPEIADDVALVAAGIGALDGALAEVGYDFDVLATSGAAEEISTAVNDPAFVDAGARLTAYRTQVCDL